MIQATYQYTYGSPADALAGAAGVAARHRYTHVIVDVSIAQYNGVWVLNITLEEIAKDVA